MMKKEVIKFFVQPNSSITKIDGLSNGMIRVKINSQPQKGKANKYLIEFLSKKLDIPKSKIKIIRGEFSKIKDIEIEGIKKDLILQKLLDLKLNNTSYR